MNTLTVLVPAYNEADFIGDTLESLRTQTHKPERVIVIDDYSTDATGDVAASYGVDVVRPDANTGSKAGAQNVGLEHVDTDLTMVLDADTTLAPDAIENLISALDSPGVAAACGFVLPRRVKTIWERGRYVEYLFSFSFYKQIQDFFGRPLISSGCLSMYRTHALRRAGGWSTRTMAEDMDLTWTLYQAGHKVRFIPEALCYPVEPDSLTMMHRQLKRWSAAFLQNVRMHGRKVSRIPFLFSAMAISLTDAFVNSVVYLMILPLLIVLVSPWFLIGYVIDAPVIAVPTLIVARRRGEFWRALSSMPSLFILRVVTGFIFLKSVVTELILRRPLQVYEKGH